MRPVFLFVLLAVAFVVALGAVMLGDLTVVEFKKICGVLALCGAFYFFGRGSVLGPAAQQPAAPAPQAPAERSVEERLQVLKARKEAGELGAPAEEPAAGERVRG